MSASLIEFTPAPPLIQQDRILLAPTAIAAWADLLSHHGWALAEPGDEIDVLVCFDAESARLTKTHQNAGVIHMPATGATWAGEGADLVLYDPEPREFLAACRRAQRLTHARNATREIAADILECAPDAVFVLDWDRCVVYQNPRALALIARFEGGNGDVRGETLDAHVPRELLTLLEPSVAATLRDGGPRTFDVYLAPTHSWIEINVYFIPGGATATFRDITARKGAEAAALERATKDMHPESP